ncbi:PH domain-containing protein [Halobacteria archaeon AArc-dxtr1]|nr:PH domain-containing protein [Halobacteria archaeon AArc-dxtr1]
MNRLHPLSAVTLALNRGFLAMAIVFGLGGALGAIFDVVDVAWMIGLAPVGFVLGGVYGIGYYLRFEYEVTADTFDVSSGVFSRRSREIPYHRIQNVDLRQGVLQRLLGLATLSVETAGGGATEATLNFVSQSEATRLQRDIRRRTASAREARKRSPEAPAEGTDQLDVDDGGMGSGEPEPVSDDQELPADDHRSLADDRPTEPVPEHRDDESAIAGDPDAARPQPSADESAPSADATTTGEPDWGQDVSVDRSKPLFDLQSKELLLYAFTSFRPAAAAAVLFGFFLATGTILEYLVAVAEPVGGPEDLETGTATNYGVLTIVSAIHGIAITYLVSVAYTFGTYYDFELGRIDEDFVYERGLLQRYSGSIPAEKVQSVTVIANPAQRLIGYAGMWIETAGYGPESNGGSQSAVPLAETGRVYTFTERLTGVETPAFDSPPLLARRRYLARYSLIAGAIVFVAYLVTTVTVFEQWYLAAVVFTAVPIAAHLRYVNLGYYVGDEHIVVRRGFWRRRTTVIPYYRIQTVNTRRSIFQRRLGLASVVIDTASSQTFSLAAPTIYDLELEQARAVHEESRGRLQTALRERAAADDIGLSVDFT